MPSNSSDSNEPTAGWWGDESYKSLMLLILQESTSKLEDAIRALEEDDLTAYASSIQAFGRIRRTASIWLEDQ